MSNRERKLREHDRRALKRAGGKVTRIPRGVGEFQAAKFNTALDQQRGTSLSLAIARCISRVA